MESEKTRNEKINQVDQTLKEYAKQIREAAEGERSRKAGAMKPYQKLLDDIKAAEKKAEYARILDRLLR